MSGAEQLFLICAAGLVYVLLRDWLHRVIQRRKH